MWALDSIFRVPILRDEMRIHKKSNKLVQSNQESVVSLISKERRFWN